MNRSRVTVNSGKTFKHPYESTRINVAVQIEGRLNKGDNFEECLVQLQNEADFVVGMRQQKILDELAKEQDAKEQIESEKSSV